MRTATNKGSCRIDSVHMGEVTIDVVTDPNHPRLVGKAVYVNSETGDRMGQSNVNVWSEKTWGAVQALLDAMEEDLARSVFGDNAAGGVEALPIDATGSVPGL